MSRGSLLGRIRRGDAVGSRRAPTYDELRADVLGHLAAICATREGSVITRPDYGIPSVSEMVYAFPDAIVRVARALRHTIQTYETRLTNVSIRHVAGDGPGLTLCYEITAQLVESPGSPYVRFETRIGPDKRVLVS